jgi:hypothetical protein
MPRWLRMVFRIPDDCDVKVNKPKSSGSMNPGSSSRTINSSNNTMTSPPKVKNRSRSRTPKGDKSRMPMSVAKPSVSSKQSAPRLF